MVKILEEPKAQEKWSAKIRCAEAVMGYNKPNRVDGCFALLEISHDDIKSYCDSDGDWTFTTVCPVCGLTLHPKWQIGEGPLQFIMKRDSKRK